MSDEQSMKLQKNSIAIQISREMALIHGLVEPTPEERAEMDERHRLYVIEENRRAFVKEAAIGFLGQIEDEPSKSMIALHGPVAEYGHDVCQGCDADGYERECPEWPCRTIETIANHYGIELP